MTITEAQTKIAKKNKGVDRKVVYSRPVKVLKPFKGVNLVKVSELYGRVVNYESQKSVAEARENGREHKPNNWEKISDGLYRKPDGKLFFCMGHSVLAQNKNRSWFLLNGKPVAKEEIEEMLPAAEKKSGGEKPDYITLMLERILDIA